MVQQLTQSQRAALSKIPAFRKQLEQQQLLQEGKITELAKSLGGGPSPSGLTSQQKQQIEQERERIQRETAEKKRKAEVNKQIINELGADRRVARENFLSNIRNARGIQERLEAQKNFARELDLANARALAKRVEAGISKGGAVIVRGEKSEQGKTAAIRVDKENFKDVLGFDRTIAEEGKVATKTEKESAVATKTEKESAGVVALPGEDIGMLKPERTYGGTSKEALEMSGKTISGKLIKFVIDKTGRLVGDLPTDEILKKEILKREGPVIAEDYTVDVTQAPGITTGGTAIATQREKTFYEKYELNPKSKSSQELKSEVEAVQSLYEQGDVSEENANKQINEAVDRYTKEKIKQGIPLNLALGAAFGALQATPLGPVANVVLTGELILKRKQLSEQFRKYPLESALSSSAFLLGGLVSARTIAGIKTGAPKVEISSPRVATIYTGKQKTKIVNEALNLDPVLKQSYNSGKVTADNAYLVVTEDGRSFVGVEFVKLNKLTKEGIKGERSFIGFELAPKGKGTVAIGKSFTELLPSGSESVARVIQFTPSKTRLGRLKQKILRQGEILNIAEKSRTLKTTGTSLKRGQIVESDVRILNTEKIQRSVISEALKVLKRLETKAKRGERITPGDIKQVVNLEKRFKGEKPFSLKEFNEAKYGSLSYNQLLTKLKEISGKQTVIKRRYGTGIKRVGVKKEETAGRGLTEPVKSLIKVKKTSLKAAERPKATISQVSRRLSRMKKGKPPELQSVSLITGKKIKQVAKKLKQTPSSAFIVGLTAKVKRTGASAKEIFAQKLKEFRLLKTPTAVTQSVRGVQDTRQILKLKSEYSQIQNDRQILITKEALSSDNREKLAELTAQSQVVLEKLKDAQKPKSYKSLVTRPGPTVTKPFKFPEPRTPPPPPTLGSIGKFRGRKLGRPLTTTGYNTLVKRKNRFKKINKVPLEKTKAQDLGAYVTDRSLAATWKIKKANRKAQKPVRIIPKDYYLRSQSKFRDYKVRKGKKIKLDNTFIERRKYRLDSYTEKQQIDAAKFVKRLSQRFSKPVKPLIKAK